jgi:hypothetical protein
MAKPDGPQWIRWPYWHSIADFDHKIPERDPDGPRVAFFHAQPAEGNEGKKPHMISADPNIFTSPTTGRDYAATIKAQIDNYNPNDRRYSLDHVQEYSGLKEMADFISNSIDFMEQRGVDEVKATPEDVGTTLETDDLVKNLYEKRPEFPKSFPSLSRAQFVAETLINRRDSGIPLTPRRRKQ